MRSFSHSSMSLSPSFQLYGFDLHAMVVIMAPAVAPAAKKHAIVETVGKAPTPVRNDQRGAAGGFLKPPIIRVLGPLVDGKGHSADQGDARQRSPDAWSHSTY